MRVAALFGPAKRQHNFRMLVLPPAAFSPAALPQCKSESDGETGHESGMPSNRNEAELLLFSSPKFCKVWNPDASAWHSASLRTHMTASILASVDADVINSHVWLVPLIANRVGAFLLCW